MVRTLVACAMAALLAGGATPALAQTSKSKAAPAHYDARIRRDDFGVPHVLGKTDADAAYGLAFAQSEDDFVTVQDSVMTSRGRQALLRGSEGVPSDTLFALMDVKATLDAGYLTQLSPHVRGMLEAYAAGVNRYAALHPDKVSAASAAGHGPRHRRLHRLPGAELLRPGRHLRPGRDRPAPHQEGGDRIPTPSRSPRRARPTATPGCCSTPTSPGPVR